MQNYLSNIRARMDSPLRIRIGGNSMDGSTYVANQTNMITLSKPDAYYNDVCLLCRCHSCRNLISIH